MATVPADDTGYPLPERRTTPWRSSMQETTGMAPGGFEGPEVSRLRHTPPQWS